MLKPPCQAKVPQPSIVMGIKHHIAGLHIPVNDLSLQLLMQIVQRTCQTLHNFPTPHPPKWLLLQVLPKQHPVKAEIRHVVIHKVKLILKNTPTPQGNKVLVAKVCHCC
ncbi:hypothetical protein V8G54_010604 [Vigna mungo]|uniref:Uncharacterized protein n=1 Tax=Vigna mungo TaxID=3915 RepID=A0AAQ3NZ72_VIGMU